MSLNQTHLTETLYAQYRARFPKSAQAHERSLNSLVDGVSHTARLVEPYPIRIENARGAIVEDIDGHEIVDLWQGHYANIIGHNPEPVRRALIEALEAGNGLQTGHVEEAQATFAEMLLKDTGDDRVRMTTAGTLATMYAMMLARGYTGRQIVVKTAGGWHGASPSGLRGVQRNRDGYNHTDSQGITAQDNETTLVIAFNDSQALIDLFETRGNEIACFICEPVLGSAGFIPATREYLQTARQLTERFGSLLILDEIITGYRYCLGGVQQMYNVKADLTTYGKVIGGGMPMAAITGRADIMDLMSVKSPRRVWGSGGTFSAHPSSLIAGTAMISYLHEHKAEVYPVLANTTEILRNRIEETFARHNIIARCTGHSDGPLDGSLVSVYFPKEVNWVPSSAEEMLNPLYCNAALRENLLRLGMLINDVNVVHGFGALSTTHTLQHIDRIVQAYDAFAQMIEDHTD